MGGRGSDGGVAPGLRIEWDPAKSESNKTKHGVDFTEAQTIWQDPFRAVLESLYEGEARQLTIGMLNGKLYTVVTTTRGGAIRIISVRRSRRDEEGDYERRRQDDRR